MTPLEAEKAINARWMALWPGLSGDIPYTLDNLIRSDEPPTFARLQIISLGEEQTTLNRPGFRKFEHSGIIEVKIYGPINIGRSAMTTLGMAVRTIFRATRFGNSSGEQGVTTHATEVSEIRNDREVKHRWVMVASTPFEYTEIA